MNMVSVIVPKLIKVITVYIEPSINLNPVYNDH